MPQKKRVKPTESESDESEISSKLENVDISFTGRFIESDDSDGIQQLLFQLLRTESIDLKNLTDIICQEHQIGSVLKEDFDDDDMEEDDDISVVFGVTTILNITKYKQEKSIIQLLKWIKDNIKRGADANVIAKSEEILSESNKLGFLINERFENLPTKASIPMITMLVKEIEKEKKCDKSFDFDYIIFISKLYKEGKETTYVNQEDTCFLKNAVVSCDYQIHGNSEFDVSSSYYRRIFIFNASKLHEIVSNIENAFP